MARVCMRPGCDRPAAARLSYDTISCQVWLDQMPDRLGPVQEICQFHAERLTVPRGWTLSDRRVDAPALFEPDHRAVRLPEPSVASVVAAAVTPVRGVAPVGGGFTGSSAVPRRSNRRRHPSSTARQLFDDDLDREVPAEPALDLDSDLEVAVVELDLDTDLEPEALPDAPAVAPVVEVAPADELVPDETVPDELVPDEVVVELVELVDVQVAEPADAPVGLDEVLVAAARVDDTRRPMPEHAEIMAEIVSVDLDDDLPESLRATSPLLARAFRATGPQRSVLSRELANGTSAEPDESAGA